MAERPIARITRVRLENWKSIASCDVELQRLTILVGPNGSGKSNFVDALRFVSEALIDSLPTAVRRRGGYDDIVHRVHRDIRRAKRVVVSIEMTLEGGVAARLELTLGSWGAIVESGTASVRPRASLAVDSEYCACDGDWYRVTNGLVESSLTSMPVALMDRLYLVAASSVPRFRPVFDFLAGIHVYDPSPQEMRELREVSDGIVLSARGENTGAVIARMERESPAALDRISQYLSSIVPNLTALEPDGNERQESFRVARAHPYDLISPRFSASMLSAGTLRAVGVLVALFQAESGAPVSLVGIEEPENSIHPGAAAVLRDALVDASQSVQVVATSHSVDLLDDKDVDPDWLLAVVDDDGVTRIGPIDDVGRSILRDRLFTAGELLRMNQLRPDLAGASEVRETPPGP